MSGSVNFLGRELDVFAASVRGEQAGVIEKDHCRVCGCTDDHACEGGCSWVEEDLCSACVGKEDVGNKGARETI